MQTRLGKLLTGQWEFLVLFTVVVLAFSLRCFFLVTYGHPLMLDEQDGIAYMQIAHDVVHFRPLQSTFMPPFYPVVIALFSFLPVDFEVAARLASVTMDVFIILPLYDLVKKLFNQYVSLCVCILWACFSLGLYGSLAPLSFSTYLFYLPEHLCSTGFFMKTGICDGLLRPGHVSRLPILPGRKELWDLPSGYYSVLSAL